MYGAAKVSSPDEYNDFRNTFTEDDHKSFEWQANTFAGCLLIPTEILVPEYNRLLRAGKNMSSMIDKFAVSKKALMYRMYKEDLIRKYTK